MSGERRGLSPADQEKIGAAMAAVFAQARAAAESVKLDELARCARSQLRGSPCQRAA
jgi:hypothetical protein